MENPVDRFKRIEQRESDRLIARRKEAWKLLNEIAPRVANDLKMISFIFGKPKLIHVENDSGKTWKWVN